MEMKNLFKIKFLVVLALFLAMPLFNSSQCAMCKAAAESSIANGTGGIEKGINSGIIYLMGVPYMLLGLFCFVFRADISKVYHNWRGTSPDAIKTIYQQYKFMLVFFACLTVVFMTVAYVQLRG